MPGGARERTRRLALRLEEARRAKQEKHRSVCHCEMEDHKKEATRRCQNSSTKNKIKEKERYTNSKERRPRREQKNDDSAKMEEDEKTRSWKLEARARARARTTCARTAA
ncbi:hypothetical protein C8Q73DRAFT_489188 [Cubamyces lactineus]|nr:hypothetical protein C8Q73DRAFT_489188 [Cubamyces lactineus]